MAYNLEKLIDSKVSGDIYMGSWVVNGGVVFILGPVLDGSNILTSPLGKQRIHINQTLQNTARDSSSFIKMIPSSSILL